MRSSSIAKCKLIQFKDKFSEEYNVKGARKNKTCILRRGVC